MKLGVPRDCVDEMGCFSRLTMKWSRTKQKLKNELDGNQLRYVVTGEAEGALDESFFLQWFPRPLAEIEDGGMEGKEGQFRRNKPPSSPS
jgi:hypothetical protein